MLGSSGVIRTEIMIWNAKEPSGDTVFAINSTCVLYTVQYSQYVQRHIIWWSTTYMYLWYSTILDLGTVVMEGWKRGGEVKTEEAFTKHHKNSQAPMLWNIRIRMI